MALPRPFESPEQALRRTRKRLALPGSRQNGGRKLSGWPKTMPSRGAQANYRDCGGVAFFPDIR